MTSNAQADASQLAPLFGAPSIAFLGVSERAAFVREGHPIFWNHNIIGLRQAFLSHFYPCDASGCYLVIACYKPEALTGLHLRLVDESGAQVCKVDIVFEQNTGAAATETPQEQRAWQLILAPDHHWFLMHQSLEGILILRPGTIKVLFGSTDTSEEVCIGTLYCGLVDPPPLTEDRIAALRANPRAVKLARVRLGCTACSSQLYVIAGIEKSKALLDSAQKIWYEDAPDAWHCGCGATVIDLTSIRKNLHGILGRQTPPGEDGAGPSFIRMYERGALADICEDFGAVLDENPPEEKVQKFLEQHTVFLHCFSPMRIRPKAPVLTHYVTDFAILDARGMLVLVELEKPALRLLKRDGYATQELQHAFDQVRSWIHTITRHWTASLDCMGFKEAEVAGIRGVVVAGRDSEYTSQDLMRLKGTDHGQIEFYTFDDLLENTVNLARELS